MHDTERRTPHTVGHERQPLVSVIIIAYNSAGYIIETLDSIAAQTYPHIELVISDDSSKDDTVAVCRQWMERHSHRFVNTTLVEAPHNRGIPANCNQGIASSSGLWIKLIAGDDLLLPDCIQANLQAAACASEPCILLSNIVMFLDGTTPRQIVETLKPPLASYWSKQWTAAQQHRLLLLNYCGNTPSFFIAREVANAVTFDEAYPAIDDYPFVLNATAAGYRLLYFDIDTVLYRKREDSAFFGKNTMLYGDFYKKRQSFDEAYRYPHLPGAIGAHERFNARRYALYDSWGWNKATPLFRLLHRWSHYLNPYYYLIKLRGYDRPSYYLNAKSGT